MMVRLCREHGLPEPEFGEDSGGFSVTFRKDAYAPDLLRKLGLNERQLRAVAYVRETGSIGNSEYQELTGVSKRTATRGLDALVELGILERTTERGRTTRYQRNGS